MGIWDDFKTYAPKAKVKLVKAGKVVVNGYEEKPLKKIRKSKSRKTKKLRIKAGKPKLVKVAAPKIRQTIPTALNINGENFRLKKVVPKNNAVFAHSFQKVLAAHRYPSQAVVTKNENGKTVIAIYAGKKRKAPIA